MEIKIAGALLLSVMTFAVLSTAISAVEADWPKEFEQFGPHVDWVLIRLYGSEFEELAALESGEIDIADASLTAYWAQRWRNNPNINMMNYGGDIGAYQVDINQNYTKPMSGPLGAIPGTWEHNIGRNLGFRHALAHLVDRSYIVTRIYPEFSVPIYTMVPPALGGLMNTVVDEHPYSPATAAAILNAWGIIDWDGDGYRNWPRYEGVPGAPNIVIDLVSSGAIGDMLMWEFTNLPGSGFVVNRWSAWGAYSRPWVMWGKSFTLYTGGWSLSRDPDYLFSLYHSSMYWNPGSPPNYANVMDPELDGYLEGIYYAQNFADAKVNCWIAQRVMAEKVLVIPLYTEYAPKAARVYYTGGTNEVTISPDDGENLYRGHAWNGFVNMAGYGLNNWWSFLNAHPYGYDLPAPGTTMTLRYGFSSPLVPTLNPLYGEWVWDWDIMGKTYDTLLKVNPYDQSEDLPWMADRWQILVWVSPYGPATELVFDLRNDIYFHDGVQLTADDIYFTFAELVQACDARGLPYPWYYSNLLDVNTVIIESPFRVRVRMYSLSPFALHHVGGNIILPRHVWGPIMMGPDMTIGTADDSTYDPETFAPDPCLIGSGPFEVYPNSIDPYDADYYVPYSYVLLRSNRFYFRYTPDLKTGGVTQVCWNTWFPGASGVTPALTIWRLNYHHAQVSSEEYIVIGDGAGLWKWWDDSTFTWVSGLTPTLPPNPPVGVSAEVDVKPPMQFNGNTPGILKKILPVQPGTFGTLVQKVVVIERDTTVDTGAAYPWRMFTIVKPQPAVFIEGDINDDSLVDITDAMLLSVQFGLPPWAWVEIDVNSDSAISLLDAAIIVRDWSV